MAPLGRGVFLAFLFLNFAAAQDNVNIMVLHEDQDDVATGSIDAAIEYFTKNSQGVQVKNKYMVPMGLDEDMENIVSSACTVYDEAIDNNEPPHVVLDVTKVGMISEAAKSFTKTLALPTFAASYGYMDDVREWQALTSEQQKYLVRVIPPGDIMMQVIHDIVKRQNISNAAIIYDESFKMDLRFKTLLQNLPCRHIMHMVEDDSMEVQKQLDKLASADIVNYFLLLSNERAKMVLDAATDLEMFGKKYAWHVLSKDLDDVSCDCEDSQILIMKPFARSDVRSRLNNLRGSYNLDVKPEIDAAFYFDFAHRAILAASTMAKAGKYKDFKFMKCTDFDENKPISRSGFDFKNALEEAPMTDTWAPIKWGVNGMTYPVVPLSLERSTITQGKIVTTRNLGQWDAGIPGKIMLKAGMNLDEHSAKTVYRLVTVLKPPFMYKTSNESGVFYYGYLMDLLSEIIKIKPFEYEIYEAPDGKMGTMNKNMEWDGVMRELIERRADFALATLSVMAERETFIDFTVPYYDLVGISILMKKIKPPASLFKFLSVLEAEVWICILISYLITSVIIWIFDYFSPFSYQNNKEEYIEDDEKRVFDLKEGFWFCMTSLTPQGGGEAPKNVSGRLVAATWWLFGFIIIASYTANLAAFLTVSRLDTPITSLDGLASQYKLQYSAVKGSDAAIYFDRMTFIESQFYDVWKYMSLNESMNPYERSRLAVWEYPVSDKFSKIWQTMRENRLVNSFKEGIERVRASISSSEGFALIGDGSDIRYQILTNCDLQDIGSEFSRKPYALAVQQGSPLKEFLNDAILKLLNMRKMETLKERWWNRNPNRIRCDGSFDQSDGINIENIGGVFIVICVGIILSLIALVVEYYWYKDKAAEGNRVTDSGRIVPVKGMTDEVIKSNYGKGDSVFNTQYKMEGSNIISRAKKGNGTNEYDIAPVPNPW